MGYLAQVGRYPIFAEACQSPRVDFRPYALLVLSTDSNRSEHIDQADR